MGGGGALDRERRRRGRVDRRRAGGASVGQHVGQGEHPAAGARRTLGLDRDTGNERLQRLVIGELAARLREQMDARRPAAAHRDQVTADRLRRTGRAVRPAPGDQRMRDAPAPARPDDRRASLDAQAGAARRCGPFAIRRGAKIGDHRNGDAGPRQFQRRAIGRVMRRRDDCARAGLDAIAGEETARRVGQHDAGPVVVGKHQRALVRAGRQHHPPRANLPQTLARQPWIGLGQMIADALQPGQEVLRVIAENLRARQQRDVGRDAQLRQRRGEPVGRRRAVDPRAPFSQQRAARFGLLVKQHHPCAGARCGQRGGEARRAGAHHRDIAMGVEIGVVIGVARVRRAAEPGGAADQRLVEGAPRALRLHEGLVVEAGREQRREQAVDRLQIEAQRRPVVLAHRREALIKFDLRRA